MLLAGHFGSRMLYELDIDEDLSFSKEAIWSLENHVWSGNVRELKNVIERAVYRAGRGKIETIDFNPFVAPFGDLVVREEGISSSEEKHAVNIFTGFKELVGAYERELIRQALEDGRYNQKKSAELLGLTYDQFRGLLRKYREELDL